MIRVFEAFSGIGTQRMALRNLGINHEVVAIAEIDKYALKSYEAIHGDCPNLGDISKIETTDIPDHDLFTYSFPCQDISVAGKQKGLDMNGGTRSGLLWECQKVIAAKKPKYLLMENVKNLIGKKHKPNFDKWLNWLEEQGYTNYWQVLNAKDYGIPQNRERVFCVSILGKHEPYIFPEKRELTIRLKDVLEDEVDEKFYLSEEKTGKLISRFELENEPFLLGGEQKNQVIKKDGISTTLTSSMGTGGGYVPMVNRIGGIFDKGGWRQPSVLIKNATKKGYLIANEGDGIDTAYPFSKTRRGRVQKNMAHTITTDDSKAVVIGASRGRDPKNPSDRKVGNSNLQQRLEINKNGTSNTITSVQKDNYVIEANVLTPKRTEYGKAIRKEYESGLINESRHNMTEMRPRTDGVSNTLTTVQKDNYVVTGIDVHPFSKKLEFRGYKQKEIPPCLLATDYKAPKTTLQSDFRIRKLTPKECWRLMGCSDEDFKKAEQVNSNSQLYKQAGNAIVVDVLEAIFSQLFLNEAQHELI